MIIVSYTYNIHINSTTYHNIDMPNYYSIKSYKSCNTKINTSYLHDKDTHSNEKNILITIMIIQITIQSIAKYRYNICSTTFILFI